MVCAKSIKKTKNRYMRNFFTIKITKCKNLQDPPLGYDTVSPNWKECLISELSLH
jgi:hypothetical protein